MPIYTVYKTCSFRAIRKNQTNSFCLSVLGLPLSEDIEGPSTIDGVEFIVGARPIETGADSNFIGLVTGLVIMSQIAPSGFSGCVLQCLESLTADTTGTAIVARPFNREQRQLVLYGPASPETFEAVLRTVTYTNLARDINVERFDVNVHDGIATTLGSITVVQGMMRRKRDAGTMVDEAAPQNMHHRNIVSVGERNEEKEKSHSSLSSYWPLAVIALSSIGILITILVFWGIKPTKNFSLK